VLSSAASNASWSELNALYEENAAALYQAIQDMQAHIALLSPPNSLNFIFLGTHPNYIYNPLLTDEEHNATPPPVTNYALLELAKEALHHQQIKDGSPLPSLQYPQIEMFVVDEDIPINELPPP
jgi:hypothetical protein